MSHRQPLIGSDVQSLGADQTVTSTTYVDVLSTAVSVTETQYVLVWANLGRISGNAVTPNRLIVQLWDDTGATEVLEFQVDANTSRTDVPERPTRMVWAVQVTGGVAKTVKLRAKVETAGDSFILRATDTQLGHVKSGD